MTKPKLYLIDVLKGKTWKHSWWTSFPNSCSQNGKWHHAPVRLSRARYCMKVAQKKWPLGEFRIVEAE